MKNDHSSNPSSFIIRDIGDTVRNWSSGLSKRVTSRKEKKDDDHRPQSNPSEFMSSPVSSYASNYEKRAQKIYNEYHAQEVAARSGPSSDTQKMEEERKRTEEQNKKYASEQEANNYRSKAETIKDQIHYWQQQRGQAGQDDSVIQGTIHELEQQFYAIPSEFRN